MKAMPAPVMNQFFRSECPKFSLRPSQFGKKYFVRMFRDTLTHPSVNSRGRHPRFLESFAMGWRQFSLNVAALLRGAKFEKLPARTTDANQAFRAATLTASAPVRNFLAPANQLVDLALLQIVGIFRSIFVLWWGGGRSVFHSRAGSDSLSNEYAFCLLSVFSGTTGIFSPIPRFAPPPYVVAPEPDDPPNTPFASPRIDLLRFCIPISRNAFSLTQTPEFDKRRDFRLEIDDFPLVESLFSESGWNFHKSENCLGFDC